MYFVYNGFGALERRGANWLFLIVTTMFYIQIIETFSLSPFDYLNHPPNNGQGLTDRPIYQSRSTYKYVQRPNSLMELQWIH